MTNIGAVLEWKFPEQKGWFMLAGVITKYPGGIPTQADQDTWTAEYALYLARKTKIKDVNELRDVKKALPITSEGISIDAGDMQSGQLSLTAFLNIGVSFPVTSITRVGTLVSVVTPKKHNRVSGETVLFVGADPSEYNISVVITVTGKKGFDYTITGSPASPATGTISFTVESLQHIPATNETDQMITKAAYLQISADVNRYVSDCRIRARELKNLVLAAADVAAVDAITITTGWPDTE